MEFHNIKIIILMLVCLLSVNLVLALGVSSPYWKGNPLEMYPGQTRDVAFALVNKPDAETVQAFVLLEDGAGIAKITSGTKYTVIPGTTNTKVVLRVSIPKNANIGDSYDVKFSVKSASEGEGTVLLDIKYDVKFPVKVVDKSEVSIVVEDKKLGEIIWFMAIGIIIITMVVIVYFLLRQKTKVVPF